MQTLKISLLIADLRYPALLLQHSPALLFKPLLPLPALTVRVKALLLKLLLLLPIILLIPSLVIALILIITPPLIVALILIVPLPGLLTLSF